MYKNLTLSKENQYFIIIIQKFITHKSLVYIMWTYQILLQYTYMSDIIIYMEYEKTTGTTTPSHIPATGLTRHWSALKSMQIVENRVHNILKKIFNFNNFAQSKKKSNNNNVNFRKSKDNNLANYQ